MDIQLQRVDSKPALASTKKTPADKGSSSMGSARQPAAGSTEASLKLTSLTATLASLPVVEDARVERISSALRSGHYQVDAQKLADKIIAFEESLPE